MKKIVSQYHSVIPHGHIQQIASKPAGQNNFATAKSFNIKPSDGAYGVPEHQISRGSQEPTNVGTKGGMQVKAMSSNIPNSGGTNASAGKGFTSQS